MASREHGPFSPQECATLKVLVTGASGFIGSQLLPLLNSRGHEVVAASRLTISDPGITWRQAPELGSGSDWSRALQGAEAVVHLAGRAQIGLESEAEEDLCHRINAEGTARLARQAAECGVQHFLFLSSVHAVAAESNVMIAGSTSPHPVSAYGRSKLAAEEALLAELASSMCRYTVLRPPAVYGPSQASFFCQLVKMVSAGIPLPLASVRNRRSFLYVGNLIDAIAACLGNPSAFQKVFLPSDREDVSTPDLIRAIARANDEVEREARSVEHGTGGGGIASERESRRSARVFHFPRRLLKGAGQLPGLGALRKLSSSLYVDSEPLHRALGWTPPYSMHEALVETLRMGVRPIRRGENSK